jgi:hypothetical protein
MPLTTRTLVLAHYRREDLDCATAALILGIHPRYILRVWHANLQWYAETNYPVPSPSSPSPSTGRAGVGDQVGADH